MAPPATVDWWADPRIRVQLMTWVPPLLLFVKTKFGVSLGGADQVVDVILEVGSLVGAYLAWRKRIRDGKNPADPAPEIKTPAVVTAVSNLTK